MNEEIYKEAVATWGISSQLIIAIEEMAELTKEITKYLKFGKADKLNRTEILEEIADVELMLDELKWYYSGREEVDDFKEGKLCRLQERIDSQKLRSSSE